MFARPDLTVKEVEAPYSFVCRSGHTAPTVFQRDQNLPAEPTKFFSVDSDVNPHVNGVYCEPCLIVAHAMSDKNKTHRKLK